MITHSFNHEDSTIGPVGRWKKLGRAIVLRICMDIAWFFARWPPWSPALKSDICIRPDRRWRRRSSRTDAAAAAAAPKSRRFYYHSNAEAVSTRENGNEEERAREVARHGWQWRRIPSSSSSCLAPLAHWWWASRSGCLPPAIPLLPHSETVSARTVLRYQCRPLPLLFHLHFLPPAKIAAKLAAVSMPSVYIQLQTKKKYSVYINGIRSFDLLTSVLTLGDWYMGSLISEPIMLVTHVRSGTLAESYFYVHRLTWLFSFVFWVARNFLFLIYPKVSLLMCSKDKRKKIIPRSIVRRGVRKVSLFGLFTDMKWNLALVFLLIPGARRKPN